MNRIQKTLFLLLLSFICSCSSDDQFQESSNKQNESPIKVTAILPDLNLEDINSRTSITTGTYPTYPSPVWVTGDSIGIYPDAGGDQLSFRINEGGSKTCTFDGGGWAMKSASYTAYSPFKRSYYYKEKDALPISMLNQTQNGNDNADHFGTYDIQIAKGEKPETGGLIFEFSRKVALARLEITAPKAATWTSVSLESDALFTTEAKMNLTEETPTVTPVTTSNSVTLNLENVSTTSENLSIIAYMVLLPIDLTGKTLTVNLTDSEDKTYSTNGTITNNKTNLAANAARWIVANFEEIIPNNQIWYTSSDGNIVTPNSTANFGTTIKSNTYTNGKGVITFDNNVSNIGKYAFVASESLTSITIPKSVISIENSAFIGCKSLTHITIPNSVTNIGDNAFSSCMSLLNITIPNSVTNIGENILGYCTALTDIIVEEGNTIYDSRENCNAIIKTESNALISGCKNTIIPNSVTSIEDKAFWNCESLVNITIPNSITSIGNNTFYGCKSLSNITIPNSVTTIGNNAFYACGLTNITIPNSVISIGESAFGLCDITTVTIPNSVTEIGNSTFSSCRSLTNVIIPNSVTTIGNSSFSYCTSLTSITIPNSVTNIGNNTFANCI